jgi:hypothetical protein
MPYAERSLAVSARATCTGGKRVYTGHLSEESVRSAIQTAIKAVDSKIEQEETNSPGTKQYWQAVIKPMLQQITETGQWPANCCFEGFYKMDNYDGLGLRITIKTPGARFDGYSLPILDVWFGRVAD